MYIGFWNENFKDFDIEGWGEEIECWVFGKGWDCWWIWCWKKKVSGGFEGGVVLICVYKCSFNFGNLKFFLMYGVVFIYVWDFFGLFFLLGEVKCEFGFVDD